MRLIMVRARVRDDSIDEIEAAGRTLFSALEREQPHGIRYASCRLSDGVTYLNILGLQDGVANPLSALPEARAFQENLRSWLAEPAASEPLTVVGTYRLF
ncbi:hypothetical protein AB0J74_27050 [Asanoa sp. NPDC049573]|uniref:hypothetical protein n=1 Tax=Asanoa sp. NPDC049573 TaxID=3155396 RepID=UPI00342A8F42